MAEDLTEWVKCPTESGWWWRKYGNSYEKCLVTDALIDDIKTYGSFATWARIQ